MKQDQLRAAAHNLADSISSEYCAVAHEYGFRVWDEVAHLPRRRLKADLVNGKVTSWVSPFHFSRFFRLRRFFRRFATYVPEFLIKHGCDPAQVRTIEVEFKNPHSHSSSHREVLVSVEQSDGRKVIDRYVGVPLKRPMLLDPLGRVRRERKSSAGA